MPPPARRPRWPRRWRRDPDLPPHGPTRRAAGGPSAPTLPAATVERIMPSTRIALVRHGQSTWNAEGRWQGQADPPLSPLGEAQAAAAAGACPVVDAVVTSD